MRAEIVIPGTIPGSVFAEMLEAINCEEYKAMGLFSSSLSDLAVDRQFVEHAPGESKFIWVVNTDGSALAAVGGLYLDRLAVNYAIAKKPAKCFLISPSLAPGRRVVPIDDEEAERLANKGSGFSVRNRGSRLEVVEDESAEPVGTLLVEAGESAFSVTAGQIRESAKSAIKTAVLDWIMETRGFLELPSIQFCHAQ